MKKYEYGKQLHFFYDDLDRLILAGSENYIQSLRLQRCKSVG